MDKKPINRWDINFREGKAWEEKLNGKLHNVFTKSSPLVYWFLKVEPIENYKLGDAKLSPQFPTIDYKIRHRHYFRPTPDFCIELKTAMKRGWFYTTENIIYYGWKVLDNNQPSQNYLLDGYFINIPALRKNHSQWINQMIEKYYRESQYAKSQNKTKTWKTYNVYVPIREFPQQIIFRFNLDPNPITAQMKLG